MIRLRISRILLVLVAVMSFGSSFFVVRAIASDPRPDARVPEIKATNIGFSNNDQSDAVGFEVKIPQQIPAALAPSSRVLVERQFSNGQSNVSVETTWTSSDGSPGILVMTQDKNIGGLAVRGETKVIQGRQFEIAVHGSLPERPFGVVDIYWRDASSAYLIMATLTHGIRVDDVIDVALSVE